MTSRTGKAAKTAAKKTAAKKAAAKKTAAKKTTAKQPAQAAGAKVRSEAGLLAPALEKRLLSAFKRARYLHEVEQALAELLPEGVARAAVLWDLALRGRLALDRIPVVDALIEDPAPSPAALVAMWGHFQPGWLSDHATQFPGTPSFLFTLVYKAIQVEPAPWVQAVRGLPEPLRGVVWLELLELGAAVPPPEVRAELLARVLTDPFEPSRTCVIDNLKILGLDADAIARELLPRLPHDRRPSLDKIEPLLSRAELPVLTRLLTAEPPGYGEGERVGRLLRARADDVDALVALARAIRAAFPRDAYPDQLVQAVVDVALERCQAAGAVPPVELDGLATFVWTGDSPAPACLAAWPKERLQARIRRGIAESDRPWEAQRFFPAVRHAYDDAMLAEVLAAARAVAQRTVSRANQEPISLGAIGPRAIPAFERAIDAARTDASFGREYHRNRWITQLRKAIAVALLEAARAGEEVDPRWDALLGPHPECLDGNILDEVFNGGRLFGHLLDRLPEARAKAIVDAWLAADHNDKLGVRGALERELSDERQRLLSTAEPLLDRLRRLVAETGLTPDTRIYALEPHEELDPRSNNRSCSAPRGLADDRWPRHKRAKMEHVLTLDLDEAPELRRLAPALKSARALALFVSSRDGNEAYTPDNDETAIVGLSAAELAAGHAEEGGSFSIHALDVPGEVFGAAEGPIGELRSAIWKLRGRALGEPMWVQGEESGESLLLQFDEGLASINLGDCGVMYVFPSGAFWQCY